MDHATAHFIDIQNNSNRTVKSAFTVDTKGEAFSKSESLMHNKRQQGHEAFYKEIAQGILKYNRVLLFGPTNAKQNYTITLTPIYILKTLKSQLRQQTK